MGYVGKTLKKSKCALFAFFPNTMTLSRKFVFPIFFQEHWKCPKGVTNSHFGMKIKRTRIFLDLRFLTGGPLSRIKQLKWRLVTLDSCKHYKNWTIFLITESSEFFVLFLFLSFPSCTVVYMKGGKSSFSDTYYVTFRLS